MAQAKGGTNWFAIIIATVTVVALVGVGALVVWLNGQASAPGVTPTAANINAETGAISFGAGPETIGTYVDFGCPHCAEFESIYGESLSEAAADDTITLEVYPVSVMDHAYQGTQFPSRAAGAMYCVAENAPDSALPFMELMFANQPDTRGMSDEQITAIASRVGADAAADCIADRTYVKFSQDMTSNIPVDPATGRAGTPTVTVNDERIGLDQVNNIFAGILG